MIVGKKTNVATQEEIDSLIKIASSDPKDEKPIDEITRWLIATGIQPGKHVIPPKQLFTVYREWSKHPVSFMSFQMQMKQHFEKHWYLWKYYYLVDQGNFPFPLDTEEKMKEELAAAKDRRNARYVAKKKAQGQPEGSES